MHGIMHGKKQSTGLLFLYPATNDGRKAGGNPCLIFVLLLFKVAIFVFTRFG